MAQLAKTTGRIRRRPEQRNVLDAVALQQHLSSSLRLSLAQPASLHPLRRRARRQTNGVDARSVDESDDAPLWEVDGWVCEVCTLRNSEQAPRCSACLSSREAQRRLLRQRGSSRRQLSMAQKRGLVEGPPPELTEEEWVAAERRCAERRDSFAPCPICRCDFGLADQVLLSCSHVFHRVCLESFERFVRSQDWCCPLCRTKDYQKRPCGLGAAAHRHRCAVRMQSAARGAAARGAFRQMLSAHYAGGKGDELQRRKFYARKLGRVSERIMSDLTDREDALDRLFREFDDSVRVSRAVLRTDTVDMFASRRRSSCSRDGEMAREDRREWEAVREAVKRRGPLGDCPICMGSLGASEPPPIPCGGGAGEDGSISKEVLPRPLALLSCSHCFHAGCIEAFEQFRPDQVALCPVCRTAYRSLRLK